MTFVLQTLLKPTAPGFSTHHFPYFPGQGERYLNTRGPQSQQSTGNFTGRFYGWRSFLEREYTFKIGFPLISTKNCPVPKATLNFSESLAQLCKTHRVDWMYNQYLLQRNAAQRHPTWGFKLATLGEHYLSPKKKPSVPFLPKEKYCGETICFCALKEIKKKKCSGLGRVLDPITMGSGKSCLWKNGSDHFPFTAQDKTKWDDFSQMLKATGSTIACLGDLMRVRQG